MTDAKYDSLAELREALRSDDSDRSTQAVMDVMDHDIRPKEVQTSEPPVEKLADAGIIPKGGGENPSSAHLLAEIRDILLSAHGAPGSVNLNDLDESDESGGEQ